MYKYRTLRYSLMVAGCSTVGLSTGADLSQALPAPVLNGKVVFVSKTTGGKNDLYSMNADGTGLTQLTNTPSANEDTPAVAPDGTTVVFASDRTRSGDYDLYSIGIDGRGEKLLNNELRSQRTPSFSPDGRYIYYDSSQDASTGSINRDVYRMDADGKNQVNITNTPTISEDGPRVAPCDPTKIVVTRNTPSGRFDIFEFDTTTKAFTNLTNDPAHHDRFLGFSPDCKKIVYEATNGTAGTPNNWDINLMDRDGTNEQNLTDTTGDDRYPSFSPDGRKIIFTSDRGGAGAKVFTMLSDGTDQKVLTTGSSTEERPAWGFVGRTPVTEERGE